MSFFAVVALLTLLRPYYLPTRWSSLLRVLIPCWRFFEEPTPRHTLHYRVADSQECLGPWLIRPRVQGRSLFCNGPSNLYLACEGVVHGLTQVLAEQEPGENLFLLESLDYGLTQNLVREWVPQGSLTQFKICRDGEDIFLSAPFWA